jgi:hypothetical protein
MLVLSDDEIVAVGRAFDRAWDSFLKKGLLTPYNLHQSRSRLAERILRSAFYGERDEWRLARDAVAYVQEVGPAVRLPQGETKGGRRRARKRRQRGSAAGRPAVAAAMVPGSAGDSTLST